MIESLTLKFGRAPGLPNSSFEVTPVTVFVGPNNSGKSKILNEINHFCINGTKALTNVILEDLIFKIPDPVTALDEVKLKARVDEAVSPGNIIVGSGRARTQVSKANMDLALREPNTRPQWFCPWYLNHQTIMLDGKNRISLVNDQNIGNLLQAPQSSFQTLFKNEERREEVRRIVHEAFSQFLLIDPSTGGKLGLRLSLEPPKKNIELSLAPEALNFLSEAAPINLSSDGVKAFTGMITEIIAGDPKILLIDEPEAFLHPTLSNKLGKEITKASLDSNKRIFVSTHSPNFVMGCIQSGAPVNIVRLTYKKGIATARLLKEADVLKLMRDPLLRATKVLEALFYENIIVTEGDSDRAFYQEINDRLLEFKPIWGIPNCLFLNAQNKQTIRKIIQPLRELGIPAAGIFDVDVLKDGGTVWTSLMKSLFIPEDSLDPVRLQRAAIKVKIDTLAKNIKTQGGISLLNPDDRNEANILLNFLADYGLFTVRKGEVESWLKNLDVRGEKSTWLVRVFEKMGNNPQQRNYLRPGNGDVWKFFKEIKCWFEDPERKGIPN